jgi:hypothetical protein
MISDSKQVAGTHYKADYQHWDYCVEVNVPNLEYAATKYITRWRKKNGVIDLEKALSYVVKRLECIHSYTGIIRGARKNETLFQRFCVSNSLPQEEIYLIDCIMHWKSVSQLIAATEGLRVFIECKKIEK